MYRINVFFPSSNLQNLFHFQRLKQAIKPKIKTDNEEDFEGVDNLAMQTVRS